MAFADRIAEALAGTKSVALVGDDVQNMLFTESLSWGFRLATVDAAELATFGEGHELWGSKSRAHWLLVIENCDTLSADQEDNLLDLLFDGCHALPQNTLIAAHFARACQMSDALNDPAVPVAFLAKDGLGGTALPITGLDPADLRSIPLAA